jgi:serine/threonine-protein kinase
MADSAAEFDLLFGLLALQNGLIDQGALVAAFQAWTRKKSRSLAEHLVDRGDLEADDKSLIEALVARHLGRHAGDPEESLAAFSLGEFTRERLMSVGDADLKITLGRIGLDSRPTEVRVDGEGTLSYASGAATADGSRFRVLRPHAKGGIGQVCVALDTELSREVALKEIQPHLADDPASRGRFLLEAEVTGRLEHPGIVPVYGLGVDSTGRPYYAMRFIRGDSLKQAIERFHDAGAQCGSEASPASLSLRGLLGRFVAVCNAVAYAHSRGVIHRDLKPANVMLGPYGETLVVDWGLAKVVGRDDPAAAAEATLRPSSALGSGSSETQAGTAIGTPAYMSPEQAEGRLEAIGPASDVYSLGATLYCLVTGRPPFSDGAVLEILRSVQRGEFPAPRAVNPLVPAALSAVVLKAMALRPADRYPSARALAHEVERWLADEPVSAYHEPVLTRLARWGRRHRSFVAGAGTLLLAAVLALSAGALLLQRANARTAHERDLARKNFQMARQAVDENLTRVGQNPILKEQGFHELRMELLNGALRYYQEFLAQQASDPSVQAQAAAAFERVGDIERELGRFEDALAAYEKGLAIGPATPRDPHVAAARLRMQQGQIAALSPLSRFEQAIGKFEHAIAPYLTGVGAAANPRDDLRPILAKLYNAGAEVYSNSGKVNEGLRASRRALEYAEAYIRDHPGDPAALHDLMFAYTYTTRKLIVGGDPDEALVVGLLGLKRGEATIRDRARGIDLPVDLADLYHNLATLEHPKGHSSTALGYSQKAAELADAVSRANPLLFRPLQVLTEALSYQSNIQSDVGQISEARRTAERATDAVEAFLRRTPESARAREVLGNALAVLGKAHLKMADYGAATANLRRAAKELERSREAIYLYNAACCLSMASSIDDPAEPTAADRQAKRARDADMAVALFRKAVDQGLADLALVRADPDLNPIRMRSDFIELLRKIESRAKSARDAMAPSSASPNAGSAKANL